MKPKEALYWKAKLEKANSDARLQAAFMHPVFQAVWGKPITFSQRAAIFQEIAVAEPWSTIPKLTYAQFLIELNKRDFGTLRYLCAAEHRRALGTQSLRALRRVLSSDIAVAAGTIGGHLPTMALTKLDDSFVADVQARLRRLCPGGRLAL